MRGRVVGLDEYDDRARRGEVGIAHRPTARVWVPDRKIYAPPIGWSPPPLARTPEGHRQPWRAPIWQFVTTDATSGWAVPANSTEWSGFSPNVTVGSLWLFQEASGNFADSIGSITLTATLVTAYASAVTGWTRKGWQINAAVVGGANSTSASLPDASTASQTIGVIAIVNSTPAANASLVGCGTGGRIRITTTPRMSVLSGANASTSASNNPDGAVRLWIVKYNKTGSVVTGYTSQEKLTPTFSAGSGKNVNFGRDSDNTANVTYLYAFALYNANAELADADAATLMDNIHNGHATRAWTTSFAGSLTETDSLAESIGAVYSIPNVGLSESNATDESAAMLFNIPESASESMAASESIAAAAVMVANIAESSTWSEAVAAAAVVVAGLAEGATVAEMASAALAISIALSESGAIAEAITASLGLAASSLAEALTSTEQVVGGLVFSVAADDILATAEQVIASVPFAASPSEAATLAEAIAAVVVKDGPLNGSIERANALRGAIVRHFALRGKLVRR